MSSSLHRFTPRRPLGRTGFAATLLGIGDLADRSVPLADCVSTLRRALDAGLNVVDTAPGYEDGYSEQIVGEALKGWSRDAVFVIDKVDHADEPVAPQVTASLARLQLDRADLFVFHGVSKDEDWSRLAAPGGGMEQLADCVRRGLCRFRGHLQPQPAGAPRRDRVRHLRRGAVSHRSVRRSALRAGGAAARPRARGGHRVLQDVRRGEAPRRHRGLQPAPERPAAREAEFRRRGSPPGVAGRRRASPSFRTCPSKSACTTR